MREKLGLGKMFSLLVIGIILIIVYKTFDNFSAITTVIQNFIGILTPFIVGFVIAYLLLYPVKSLEGFLDKKFKSKKSNLALSILIVYIALVLILSIIVKSLIPLLIQNVAEFVSHVPTYYQNFINYINHLPENSFLKRIDIDALTSAYSFDSMSEKYLSTEAIWGYIKNLFGIFNIFISAFICISVSIYALFYMDSIKKFFRSFVKNIWGKKAQINLSRHCHIISSIFAKYIYAELIIALIVGIIGTIILKVLNVKYAVVGGFILTLFNLIPIFGSIFSTAIVSVIAVISNGVSRGITVAILLIILQQVDSNILKPKILGKSLDLNPILIILSITIGGSYSGILGMFLAVPVMTFIKVLYEEFMTAKEKKNDLVQ